MEANEITFIFCIPSKIIIVLKGMTFFIDISDEYLQKIFCTRSFLKSAVHI